MGLGLEGAYGAEGASQALRQILMDRFTKQQTQHAQSIQDQTLANQTRSLDQNDAYRQDALKETARTHDAANQDRIFKENMTLNEAIPPGTELSGASPIVGRLQAMGSVKPRGIDVPTPAALAIDPKASPELAGTVANAPSPTGRLFTKQATQKQLDTNTDNERQARTTDAAITAKTEALNQAAQRLEMQGHVNEANILRAQAEAALAQARAAATDKKGTTVTLSAAGKNARAAIEQAGPLTDQVLEMIRKEAPDIETNPQQYNTLGAKGAALLQTAKYKLGFHDDTDPRQQLVSLLQPIQAGQYTRSSRSRQMLELALKHMADPSQTLLTQYQRAKELKSIMPEMLQGIVRAEQPVDASNPLGGSYFDPAKPQPVPSHTPAAKPTAEDLIKKYGGG